MRNNLRKSLKNLSEEKKRKSGSIKGDDRKLILSS
jgi:hypothetical protein